MARPRKPWFRKSNRRWYVEVNGKQVNLGPDRKEAHRRFHELMAQPELARTPPRTHRISLVEIVEHFLEWVQKHRAPDTYGWYQYRLERLCKAYPSLEAADLKPFMVQEWVNGYTLSVTSQRNYLRSVKRCYKWAKRQGYIDANPIADLEVPSGEQRDVSLTQGEFDELMNYVRNPQMADLLTLTWETGCRPQESLRVEARHVDVEFKRWVFHRSESKMKRISRVVYLTDRALEITRRLMLANPTGPLFRNSAGTPWSTDAVNCSFGAIRVRMGKEEMRRQGISITDEEIKAFIPSLSPTRTRKGKVVRKNDAELRAEAKRKLTSRKVAELVPRYSLYALRHSFATNALQKGIDSLTVAILLGHEDPSTLARVYQHLNHNPQHLLDEMRKAAG